MYQSLEIFRTAADMARHAGARQALTARNVANSDTPGYVARHIAPFTDVFRAGPSLQMRATKPGHFGAQSGVSRLATTPSGTEPAPNGNTVSIEEEMLNAVSISREHNRALAIYRHTMTVLRTTIGR